jgi:hypothetical protein
MVAGSCSSLIIGGLLKYNDSGRKWGIPVRKKKMKDNSAGPRIFKYLGSGEICALLS